MLAVGEEAGRGDRPRRPDRVRAQARRQLRQRARQVPRGAAVGVDHLAVDRRDLHAPIGGLQRRQRDLVLLAELRQHADDARVDPPGVDLGDPGRVDHEVLVREQRQRLRGGRDGRDRDLGGQRVGRCGGQRRVAAGLGEGVAGQRVLGRRGGQRRVRAVHRRAGSVGSPAAGDDGSAARQAGAGRRAGGGRVTRGRQRRVAALGATAAGEAPGEPPRGAGDAPRLAALGQRALDRAVLGRRVLGRDRDRTGRHVGRTRRRPPARPAARRSPGGRWSSRRARSRPRPPARASAASGEFSSAIRFAASAAGSSFGALGSFGASASAAFGASAGGCRGRRGGGRGRSGRRGTGRGGRSVARAVGRGHSRHVLRARDAGHVRGGRQRRAPTRRGRRRVRLRSGRGRRRSVAATAAGHRDRGQIHARDHVRDVARQISFRPGRTFSENCQMPTPSIAAAIITPASEDLDSRMSSVWNALPPPRDISCASWSSPASRQAPAGSRRNRARKLGSASSRSISRAATSASVGEVAIAYLTPRNRCQSGLPSTNTTGKKNTSQSVPMTPYTTGAGTLSTSRKIVL